MVLVCNFVICIPIIFLLTSFLSTIFSWASFRDATSKKAWKMAVYEKMKARKKTLESGELGRAQGLPYLCVKPH